MFERKNQPELSGTAKGLSRLIYPNREFYRSVAIIALPIVLQNTITMAVNLTDSLMVGELGEACLSGASLANQFILFMHTLLSHSHHENIYGRNGHHPPRRCLSEMVSIHLFFSCRLALMHDHFA